MLCGTEYYNEDGPPVDVGDRLNASFPNYLAKLLHQRLVHVIAEKDKCVQLLLLFLMVDAERVFCGWIRRRETLDGLKRVGFKLNWGEENAGFILSAWKNAGGYYLGGSLRLPHSLTTLSFLLLINDTVLMRMNGMGIDRCWSESSDNRRPYQTQVFGPDHPFHEDWLAIRRWKYARC